MLECLSPSLEIDRGLAACRIGPETPFTTAILIRGRAMDSGRQADIPVLKIRAEIDSYRVITKVVLPDWR